MQNQVQNLLSLYLEEECQQAVSSELSLQEAQEQHCSQAELEVLVNLPVVQECLAPQVQQLWVVGLEPSLPDLFLEEAQQDLAVLHRKHQAVYLAELGANLLVDPSFHHLHRVPNSPEALLGAV